MEIDTSQLAGVLNKHSTYTTVMCNQSDAELLKERTRLVKAHGRKLLYI